MPIQYNRRLVKSASENLNQIQRILVEDSPLWYRGYTNLDDKDLEKHMARLEESFGARHFRRCALAHGLGQDPQETRRHRLLDRYRDAHQSLQG